MRRRHAQHTGTMVAKDGEMGQGEGSEQASRVDTRPRRRESTHPGRTQGAERGNPLGVCASATGATLPGSRPTAREEQLPRRTRCPNKRRLPAERRRESITGQIGPRERTDPAGNGADVGQGTNQPKVVTAGERWRKLDTARGAVNRPAGSSSSTLPVDRTRPIGLGAVYSATGKHGVRREACCRQPAAGREDSKGGSRVTALTWRRKTKGTRACEESGGWAKTL